MAGLADLALGTAPIAGGFLLAMVTGQFKTPTKPKAPDFRGMIKQDQEILRGIPQEQAARRAELQHTLDVRIDDLIHAIHRGPLASRGVSAYIRATGATWCCLFALLFAVIWWNVPHSKTNWLPTFIVLILVAAITAGYAMRGMIRSLGQTMRRRNRRH